MVVGISKLNTSIRLSLLSVMVCTVYWRSVCSSLPVVIKAQSQTPQLRVGGYLVILIFFCFLLSPVCAGDSPSCISVLSVVHGSQKSALFIFVFFLLFIFWPYYFCASENPIGSSMCRTMLPVAIGAHIKVSI